MLIAAQILGYFAGDLYAVRFGLANEMSRFATEFA
jgi:hypothetical protein